jgi:hypothetical protein
MNGIDMFREYYEETASPIARPERSVVRTMSSPIIVGGNGHSGTRIFAEILQKSGVFMGVPGLSYDRRSKDLNIRGLMSRWMKPYLLGQSEEQARRMRRTFQTWLWILIPFRPDPWGFKNPRAMFLLPFYHDMFPGMRFIHVIRDGRDMCFGNPFVNSPTHWSFVSDDENRLLSRAERMMRFWGESNRRVKEYGESRLGSRYLRVRFEDLCTNPEEETTRIVAFINGPAHRIPELMSLVQTPKSIGRWKNYDPSEVEKVVSLGQQYLAEFGYL